jgi:nucleoside-diphosphate-sugar epimerase
MAGELILLTGSTGHIGYHVLIEALSKGYQVRAAVRSEAKFDTIKAAEPTQPYLSQLTHAVVPDIEKSGAFDEAVKDVDYIIHIASPIPRPSDDPEATIIQPAINGTLSVLHSALTQTSIKKVVITASVISVMPDAPTGPFTTDTMPSEPKGPYGNDLSANYAVSKKLAYLRTCDFIATKSPTFSIVNVMPSFLIGPIGLAKSKEDVMDGSNAMIFDPLFGKQNPSGTPSFVAHTADVSFVHVASLDPKIQGHQNLGVSNPLTEDVRWDNAMDIVKKYFPEAVESGLFPLGGSCPSIPIPYDASATERLFGIKFKSFEDMVKDTVGQYVELAKLE